MLEGSRCEACTHRVRGPRASHPQTKYCAPCAKQRKKQQTNESRPAVDRREYQRAYMRAYRRAHPALSTPYVRKHREKNPVVRTGEATLPQSGTAIWGFPPAIIMIAFLPFLFSTFYGLDLSFEAIKTAITHLNIIVVELTGLIVIGTFCWHHIRDLWGRKEK